MRRKLVAVRLDNPAVRALFFAIIACICVVALGKVAFPVAAVAANRDDISKGLHIEGTRINSWNFRINDGGNYIWDFYQAGGVSNGTNYAYSGACTLIVNGNSFQGSTGLVNKANDEIEVGPWNWSGLKISRRAKVYKDRPLARWMDIYENTSTADVNVQSQVVTNTNWTIQKTSYSSGGGSWGDKDFAFITEAPSGGNPSPPALLHIICDQRSKVRPTIQIQNNQIYTRLNFTVPARGTVIVAYFESQHTSPDEHLKTIKGFKSNKLFSDLSPAIRRLIINFSAGGFYGDVDLERSEKYDAVMTTNGDPMFGHIANPTFKIETLYGKLDVPADQIIGMVNRGDEGDVRFLMNDGQAMIGQAPDQKLSLELTAGGVLQIPFDRVNQWSYRVSKEKPEEPVPCKAYMVLRTGDRLALDPSAMNLQIRTRNGLVTLDGKALQKIQMDNPANALHRVTFLNGSTLAGMLEPKLIPVALKMGTKTEIDRDLISEIQFCAETVPVLALTQVMLSNGDELYGKIVDEKILINTAFGQQTIKPVSLKSMSYSPNNPTRAMLELWDKTSFQGDLSQQLISFQITPGPVVKIPASQISSLRCPFALPPEDTIKGVAKLVADLGSDDWKVRQKAMDELTKMGPSIIPLLQDQLKNRDAEIRWRIQNILDGFGVKTDTPDTPDSSGRSSGSLEILGATEVGVQVQVRK